MGEKVRDISGRGVGRRLNNAVVLCEGRPAAFLVVESGWLITTSLGTFGNYGQQNVLHSIPWQADRQADWLTDWLEGGRALGLIGIERPPSLFN